jgi:DNA topoisomerase-1
MTEPPAGYLPIERVKTKKRVIVSKSTTESLSKSKTKKSSVLWSGQGLTAEMRYRLETELYIPPAYKNVLLAKSATRKIQVIGTDKAGRKQYVYHAKHKAGLEKRKYSKLALLAPKIRAIEVDTQDHIKRLASSNSPNNWEKKDLIWIVLYMLVNYHFRIGCAKYTDLYKSYGITTLLPKHFKRMRTAKDQLGDFRSSIEVHNKSAPDGTTAGNSYIIEFIGKKGMVNRAVEYDRSMTRVIRHLLNRATNQGYEYIFMYDYINPISGVKDRALIQSDDIQDLLRDKYGIRGTPKMFRTYYANYYMLAFIQNSISEYEQVKSSPAKLRSWLSNGIGEYVSSKLNNTPAICKKNYLNNELFEDIIKRPKKYINMLQQKEPAYRGVYDKSVPHTLLRKYLN